MKIAYIIVFIILVFSWVSGRAQNPTWWGPLSEMSLPFSETQIKSMKNWGVGKIIEEHVGENYRTVYYFNKKGLLDFVKLFKGKKKEKRPFLTTQFKYDSLDRLIVTQSLEGKTYLYYDSIAYNNEGRLIRFIEKSNTITGRFKKVNKEEIYNNFYLLSTDAKETILIDSTAPSYEDPTIITIKFSLDINNRLIKRATHFGVDSIRFENINETDFIRKCFSGNQLLEVDTLVNGLLKSETFYNVYGIHYTTFISKTEYNYDSNFNLIRHFNGYDTIFYAYNRYGLLSEKIHISAKRTSISKFTYFYK